MSKAEDESFYQIEDLEDELEWKQGVLDEDPSEAVRLLKAALQPETPGFLVGPSGMRLHHRATLPPAGVPIRATVMWCHGLNAHCNLSCSIDFYNKLAQTGLAVFGMDVQGHGYSEGERNCIDDWRTVFEDFEALAEALMGVADPMPDEEDFNAGVSADVLAMVRKAPLFVMGQSMGGMIGMHLSLLLQDNELIGNRFKGAVLCCPALTVSLPAKPVQHILQCFVVPLCRTRAMPACLSSSSNSPQSWSFNLNDPTQRSMCAMTIRDDVNRFPDLAIGWNGPMRWATASSFSDVYSSIDEDMEAVRFPFLAIHAPEDKVCFFSGSQRLYDLCQSADKTLHRAGGERHALIYTTPDEVVEVASQWIFKRL